MTSEIGSILLLTSLVPIWCSIVQIILMHVDPPRSATDMSVSKEMGLIGTCSHDIPSVRITHINAYPFVSTRMEVLTSIMMAVQVLIE